MKNKDSSHSRLLAFARVLKQHTFKENKWKVLAHSGLSSSWYENIKTVYINELPVKVAVEVPLVQSAEFFIKFPDAYTPVAKAEIFIERALLPVLGEPDIYLCDLMGVEVQSDIGSFLITGYLENGDPLKGATSINLQLESMEAIEGEVLKVEVPLALLKQRENSWFLEELGLWVNRE